MRVMRLLCTVALAMTGAMLLLDEPATATVLCSTHSGTVKVREICKPRETQLDPVALGLQGPAGADPLPGARIVAGTIHGDNCTPLTDPEVPGTCPILGGGGFTLAAYLATDAGADCCELPQCGRCLIRYKVFFHEPFSGVPAVQLTADDGSAATYCGTLNEVTATGVTAWCSSAFGKFVPPNMLHVTAVGAR